MTTPLVSADEELHAPGADPHWQESYYFNWADLESDAFGFARIGFRFAEGRADAVVITMRGGKRELVYGAVDQKIEGDPLSFRTGAGLTVGNLTLRMDQPFEQWRIQLSGRDRIDLTWNALAPGFEFEQNHAADVIAHRHFEHPGTVVGTAQIGGRDFAIDGYGTRDKSWGPRDWGTIEGWDWTSAQFGEKLAFTAAQTTVDGALAQSGFVFYDGTCRAIDNYTLRYRWASENVAREADLTITDDTGTVYQVSSRALAQVPLYKSGMMLQETHAKFEARVGGERFSGAGILEHTWHAGLRGVVPHLPKLLPVLGDALRSRFR